MLVTFIPLARMALQTAEPRRFCVRGCYWRSFGNVPTKPLPPMTTTFCSTPIPSRGINGIRRSPSVPPIDPARPHRGHDVFIPSLAAFIIIRLLALRLVSVQPSFPCTSTAMNLSDVAKMYPFDGIHFLYNLPPVHLPHESAGLLRRKAHNIWRKAIHAGKWQNFAAGIGTGAAYVSLHGLHWHPRWITIIEYVLPC